MMEVQQPHSFDWASDAYAAFSDASKHQNKWATFNGTSATPVDPTSPFTIPPNLLTQSTARFGQLTPPEEDRSPADLARDVREGSVPVEDLMNESLWPIDSHAHLQSPPQDAQQQFSASELGESSLKRRRATRQSLSTQTQAPASTQQDDANPQPPKRKRGRPKSQPQMVEAYTADGFPFQVSSARQSHLEKNRVAAHKCRQRKKEYIGSLEYRAREFSAKNKALKENVALLRDEVLSLKNEVLRHAGCGFWAVDEYLARCAGDLLGREAPGMSHMGSTRFDTSPEMQQARPRENSNDSIPSLGSMSSSPDAEDYGGLELLKDYEDDQTLY